MAIYLFIFFISFHFLETTEIDCNLKREIVATHNEIRQKIAQGSVPNQPPAVNMQEMVI